MTPMMCSHQHKLVAHASFSHSLSNVLLLTASPRDRCSPVWDDAEFRLTFALLFYRVALFHSRSTHIRILNVLLRGMARALQIDIGAPLVSV